MKDEEEQEISGGRRHIIERPRLTRLLDETSARVILLVAPAGYGKTTLARQWLCGEQPAWYSVRGTNDVASVGIGILEAATDAGVNVGQRFRQWLLAQRKFEGVAQ